MLAVLQLIVLLAAIMDIPLRLATMPNATAYH
jgi:hypothetical protein